MASKTALLLALNIVFFALISSAPRVVQSSSSNNKSSNCTESPSPSKSHSNSSSSSGKTPSTTNSNNTKCSMDMIRLGVCINVLNGLVNATIGNPPTVPCCSVIKGLLDLEVAACICMNIKLGLLYGIVNVNIPLKINAMLDQCDHKNVHRFECADK
ncbi:putative lipid-binding protein AIR1 [Rutidosis leptorrhynchoides]|uniref:putative lipid-binding protein AIR1 n=1 Tax=Rutidosis leptorrhynchoides TaxID=125765 RepID=UPI003A99DCDC